MDSQNNHTSTGLTTLTTIVVSVCASLIAMMMYLNFFFDKPDTQQFRILDIPALSVYVTAHYKEESEQDAAMRRAFDRIQTLQDQGVIILHAQQVVFAPKTFHLDFAELTIDNEKVK